MKTCSQRILTLRTSIQIFGSGIGVLSNCIRCFCRGVSRIRYSLPLCSYCISLFACRISSLGNGVALTRSRCSFSDSSLALLDIYSLLYRIGYIISNSTCLLIDFYLMLLCFTKPFRYVFKVLLRRLPSIVGILELRSSLGTLLHQLLQLGLFCFILSNGIILIIRKAIFITTKRCCVYSSIVIDYLFFFLFKEFLLLSYLLI